MRKEIVKTFKTKDMKKYKEFLMNLFQRFRLIVAIIYFNLFAGIITLPYQLKRLRKIKDEEEKEREKTEVEKDFLKSILSWSFLFSIVFLVRHSTFLMLISVFIFLFSGFVFSLIELKEWLNDWSN